MIDVDVLLPIHSPNVDWLNQTLASLEAQNGVESRLVAVLHPDDSHLKPLITSTRLPVEITLAPRLGGLPAALNQGLQLCSAKYVARIDQDDVAEPDRFQHQVSLLNSDAQCAVVGTNAMIINAQSEVIGARNMPDSAADVVRVMRWKSAVMHPSTMLRRSIVEDKGGYSTQATGVEDYDLWLRVLTTASIRSIAKPLLRYRVHGKQMTQTCIIDAEASARILESRLALAKARGESLAAAQFRHGVWHFRQQARRRKRLALK